ncbi:hypothetical protein [Halobaculum sp. D14]|uniref:hypothetical protein n=1 Tax=Halobaculum sp. D14 TaxID=3421642 RepID=UPI003EC0E13D
MSTDTTHDDVQEAQNTAEDTAAKYRGADVSAADWRDAAAPTTQCRTCGAAIPAGVARVAGDNTGCIPACPTCMNRYEPAGTGLTEHLRATAKFRDLFGTGVDDPEAALVTHRVHRTRGSHDPDTIIETCRIATERPDAVDAAELRRIRSGVGDKLGDDWDTARDALRDAIDATAGGDR